MYVIIQQLCQKWTVYLIGEKPQVAKLPVPIGTAWGQGREDLSSSSNHLIELTIVSKQVLMQERD